MFCGIFLHVSTLRYTLGLSPLFILNCSFPCLGRQMVILRLSQFSLWKTTSGAGAVFTSHPLFLMLDPDTLGRLSSFCALVCNLLSKVHTMLFWLLLIKEISVRSFHFSILSGIFRLNFSCNIKKVGWNAHILTVYHQRIIRKMLIYGNVAITNCC